MKHLIKSKNSAFTLVELLIVIIILGVIVSIILPLFSDSSDRAKISSSLATLQTLRQQLNLAKVEHNEIYPDLGNGGNGWDILIFKTKPTSTPTGTYSLSDGSSSDVGPYIRKRPKNPFEDSDSIGSIGAPSAGVGFLYDQSTGEIKMVIPAEKITEFDLDTQDFEGY